MEVLWVAAREENPPRPLRDRMDPLTLPDHVLIRQYRLSRPAIVFLADNLSNDLKRETRRSTPLPVVLQIMAALRFYASGSFQMVVGGTLGVSQSSISRVVRDVSNALCRRARQFIKFPATNEECIRTKQQFFDIAGFPNVLGAVDGTHIAIKAPSDEEDGFVNRKNFHSINTQVICDATLRVTDLVAKWPGSTHDSFILMNSGTGIKFNEGEMPDGWLLGDSGYTLRPWLMTPILHPATEPDERYSRAQRKTRSVVERCIGVVKSRFRCIDRSGGVLQYIPERACKIITCAFILHNICIMYRLPIPNITDDHDPECDVPGPVPAPCNSGIQDLIRRRFM
ncbi:putative nuclease HARBI1 [Merluccius polli]|uniref:Putative nuclease HARBI1 n=1 Tax=Merluccius polli TaxID=89951 RepID=A0AA47MJN6_MERPO|nr:putative nuclease HARBI1 [Merluccius polli]